MAQTFTQLLADKFTYHAVDISRFEAHVQTGTIQTLKDLEASILEDLARLDPTGMATQRRRLEALQKAVKANIQDAYSGIKRDGRKDLIRLADTVSTSTADTINTAAKVSLLNVGLPAEVLAALADDSLIQGAPAREWWSRQAGNMNQRFNNTIREGVFRGEPLSGLVARVRGKAEFDYKDGIMEVGRREAEALIRTAVQAVANGARLRVMQDNPDVIKGIQALTVLDARTTELCMGRSGFSWYLDDGRPMTPETNIDFPGPPPWHFNCRTVLIPVTYSWQELASNKDLGKSVQQEVNDLPKSTQASMDGQVAADMTYEDWLKTKSEPFQRDVLGDSKWELWNNGELPLRDMIDQRGRPLTIDQLTARLKDGPILPVVPATPPPAPPPIPEPPEPVEPPPAPPVSPPPTGPRLTPKEAEAIDQYLKDSSVVNLPLRNPAATLTKTETKLVETLDSMAAASQPLPEDIVLYRAIPRDVLEGLKPGSIYTDRGFGSTSVLRDAVNKVGYVHPDDRMVLTIQDAAGTRAIDMRSAVLRHPDARARALASKEQEFILPRNTRYEVVSISKREAVLRVVPGKPSVPPPAPPAGPAWKPTMTQAEADAFTQDSALKDQTVYHFTGKAAAREILASGFKAGDGSVYGRGVHFTTGAHGMNTGATGVKSGELRAKIRAKLNASRVFETTTPEEFTSQLKKMGATSQDIQDPATFLHAHGYDAIRVSRGIGMDAFITVFKKEQIAVITGKAEPLVPPKAAPKPTPKATPKGGPPWTKTTPGYEWHEATMTKAPDYVKRAIGNLPPVKRVQRLNEGSAYWPGQYRINMKGKYSLTNDEHQAVWRHEYGHHVDYVLGKAKGGSSYISSTRTWEAAWSKDAQNALDTSKTYNHTRVAAHKRAEELVAKMQDVESQQGKAARDLWVKDVFSQAGLNYDDFQAMMNNSIYKLFRKRPVSDSLRMLAAYEHAAFTADLEAMFAEGKTSQMGSQFMDTFGAITKNKIGYGHKTAYYDESYSRKGAEAFANVFSALSHENQTYGKIMERFFPNLTQLVKGALENA